MTIAVLKTVHNYTFLYIPHCAGIFDEEFIEDRKKGLEEFVNK